MTDLHADAAGDNPDLSFTGERIVPGADNCEPRFAQKMYQEHIARYLFASQVVRGKHVLDVACGVGYGSQLLANQGAASVTAFDLSEEAVTHARKFYQHEAVDYHIASADTVDFKRTFDVITCFEMIEHVENQERVLERIAAHLSPNGLLFISTPRSTGKPRSAFHTREFTFDEYRAFLRRVFPHIAFYVENNHFASMVTATVPEQLTRINVLEPKRLGLGAADYFVAVVSKAELPTLEAQLSLNTDEYVSMLEHDVDVLRAAETNLRQEVQDRLADLTREQAAVQQQRQLAVEAHAEVAKAKAAAQQAIAEAAQREAFLRSQIADRDARYQTLLEEHERTARDLQYATSSLSWTATKPLRQAKDLASAGAPTLRRLKSGVGKRLRRLRGIDSATSRAHQEQPGPAVETEVLFVVGCHEGESKRYRVHNLVEALEGVGTRATAVSNQEIPQLLARGFTAKAVVLFRLAYDADVERFIARAKVQKANVFFDVDDLVFEPENIDNVRALKTFTPAERAIYLDGVRRYRETLVASDYVICPTEFLKKRAEALGKSAFVIVNTINAKQISVSERARRASNADEVRIAYFSGSNTHQVDFAQCEDALRDILAKHKQTRLLVVGYLDLSDAWKPFADRIDRVGFQPYLEMLETLAGADINLAPLEAGNPYCESKSELKIFEAGLVNVPTVASPTGPYAGAIKDGHDGFLASTRQEWFSAIEKLITKPELRRSIGQNARVRAVQQFGASSIADNARAIYLEPKKVISAKARPRTNPKAMKVAWVVPHLPKGSGGHRNILRVAYHLKKFGHDLALYFIDTNDTSEQIAKTVNDHYYALDCPISRYEGQIDPVDVLFATHWSTVRVALAERSKAQRLAYFVQDFEPLFHPMGTDYILAENTYRQGLYHITSGPWCAHVLRNQFNVQAEYFQFPIDRSIYFPRERKTQRQRVLFFGRPEMPRRCFELGIEMLGHLNRIAPEVEIVMYGSGELANRTYPFTATVQGHVPGIDGLAHLYSDADVGVAFSTTNPSLVPYEMMACGLPVVDLSRQGAEINYGGRSDIALLADPMPNVMARQIAELLKKPEELKARRRAGLEYAAKLPDEEQMVRRVEELLLGLVG